MAYGALMASKSSPHAVARQRRARSSAPYDAMVGTAGSVVRLPTIRTSPPRRIPTSASRRLRAPVGERSQRDLEPRVTGQAALTLVEGQERGGAQVDRCGDMEDVERAVAAIRGPLVGIDPGQP